MHGCLLMTDSLFRSQTQFRDYGLHEIRVRTAPDEVRERVSGNGYAARPSRYSGDITFRGFGAWLIVNSLILYTEKKQTLDLDKWNHLYLFKLTGIYLFIANKYGTLLIQLNHFLEQDIQGVPKESLFLRY